MITFIKSIIIGIFAIFPGISGSALAISLGLYDRFFISLKDIRKKYLFLLSIIMGIIIGVLVGSNIILYLSSLKKILYYIFIGLTLGSIPSMIKNIKKIRYLPMVLSFIFSSITFLFCMNIFNKNISFSKMVFGGILFSFGKIVPGISSSFFLILLGIYEKILVLFSNPIIIFNNFYYYFPFILGTIIGFVLFFKLLNYLLLRKYDLLYSILIGFIISSIIPIYPKFEFNFMNIIGSLVMVICFIISFKFNQKKDI